LPPEFGVSPTFKISDLRSYFGEGDALKSRTASIQNREDDENITLSDVNIKGPIIRVRARQLILEMSSFLNTSFYNFKSRLLPNDYTRTRNEGEDRRMRGEELGVG
jgi:hypothetical protein